MEKSQKSKITNKNEKLLEKNAGKLDVFVRNVCLPLHLIGTRAKERYHQQNKREHPLKFEGAGCNGNAVIEHIPFSLKSLRP